MQLLFPQTRQDVRGLRYPGLITFKTFSGGGTSDYSVEIFINAIKHGHYTFFVNAQTAMPLMYMDDPIRATNRIDGGRRRRACPFAPAITSVP